MTGVLKKIKKILRVLGHGNPRRTLLRHGVAAALEHLGALRTMHMQTVIDIGANRGQFALAARYSFPKAGIYSFEPLEEPAMVFQRVFSGDPKTNLIVAAVGSKSGETTIHISHRDDSSSILPITDKQDELFPGTSEESTAIIKIGRLNEFVSEERIKAPALLKLDVQGYELQTLKGCTELLHMFDHVYVECSFVELYKGQAMASDVIEYLRPYGHYLEGIYNLSYDQEGKAVQADFLFGRRKDKE